MIETIGRINCFMNTRRTGGVLCARRLGIDLRQPFSLHEFYWTFAWNPV
ncbi:MAG: hypothetical protein IJ422_04860 [Oscillospiraceae bacterium]|nr:hypothetical protein [Oscillospiraceae bacterium]